ncbi:MAG: MutS-related protein [Phycisphaerae bacterium]
MKATATEFHRQIPAGPSRANENRASAFISVLYPFAHQAPSTESLTSPDFFRDLNLDQIIQAVTKSAQEYNLLPFFHAPLTDVDVIDYRQEIMRDLESPATMRAVDRFAETMRRARLYTSRVAKAYHSYERESWHLQAACAYCSATRSLCNELGAQRLSSRGLQSVHGYLSNYIASEVFALLETEANRLNADLEAIKYSLVISGGSVTVLPYREEPDYTAVVENTFERFRHETVKNHLSRLAASTGMNHIQDLILRGVARLFPSPFQALLRFFTGHAEFADATVLRLDREIQFYVSYLRYMEQFRRAGLSICYPKLHRDSKEVSISDCFDFALAAKLLAEKHDVVTNDIALTGAERILVISGPNQGGKTTLARTFGQVHYLAALGLPVAGKEGQLFLVDRLFTHFEREESIQNLRGKLQDDLVRIHEILERATPNSIVIFNELFSSTTLEDAVYLGKGIMSRLSEVDLVGVWVTFLTELASFNPKTVSMVSMIDPEDPAVRTFKVVRRPAEGLTYALCVAEKHGVTYRQLKERFRGEQ